MRHGACGKTTGRAGPLHPHTHSRRTHPKEQKKKVRLFSTLCILGRHIGKPQSCARTGQPKILRCPPGTRARRARAASPLHTAPHCTLPPTHSHAHRTLPPTHTHAHRTLPPSHTHAHRTLPSAHTLTHHAPPPTMSTQVSPYPRSCRLQKNWASSTWRGQRAGAAGGQRAQNLLLQRTLLSYHIVIMNEPCHEPCHESCHGSCHARGAGGQLC